MLACIVFNCNSRTAAFSRSLEYNLASKSLKKCEFNNNNVKIIVFPFPKNLALLNK
uniref:Uncharacterized protein n=1 Tax=Lepeophtheirus salmonis TaxID=72036 RepID=A0A0K2V9Q2_LEPSM